MRTAARGGFTLLEVLVALVLSGLVAVLAHELVRVGADSARVLARSRLTLDHSENARRWLQDAFGSLEAGGPDGAFDGRPSSVAFATWLQQPEGWFERRRVTLAPDGHRLSAHLSDGEVVPLADSVVGFDCDYLLEPGARTAWVRDWYSPLSAPVAVRLRVARIHEGRLLTDTLLLLVRGRG